MIKIPTVFILGAGASYPYGFPLGNQLKRNIIDLIDDEEAMIRAAGDLEDDELGNDDGLRALRLRKAMYAAGVFRDDMRRFRDELESFYSGSIDAFLARHSEYASLGKYLIAGEILFKEKLSNLRSQSKPEWYEYLWGRLNEETPEAFARNKLCIVTFNYDRSLEYALWRQLGLNFPSLGDDARWGMLQNIPIVHVYGQTGLPDFAPSGANRLSYGHPINAASLEIAADGIKLISEERDGDFSPFESALKLIQWAKRVFILGFGFDATNLERLRVADWTEPENLAKIYATHVGIDRTVFQDIELYFNQTLQKFGPNEMYPIMNWHPDGVLSLFQNLMQPQ